MFIFDNFFTMWSYMNDYVQYKKNTKLDKYYMKNLWFIIATIC